MAKQKKDSKEVKQITLSRRCWLEGDTIKRMDLGEIELTLDEPGPTPENFADRAFRNHAGSLRRLMAPYYRVVVIYPEREFAYGLDRWIKLMDGSRQQEERTGGGRKQPIRKGKVAA